MNGVKNSDVNWRGVLLHALPVVGVMLLWLTYWFAIANRYIVFLYNHDMGPLVPDTSPFSRVTSTRYWMAALVASGGVMVLYAGTNWLIAKRARCAIGRVSPDYRPPAWWRVWLMATPLLLIGIPAITMTVNAPTLPPWNAAQVTLATLVGVGLALMPGKLAAERPGELMWLFADGIGMALIMLNLIHIEKVRVWLERGATAWLWMIVVALVAGLLCLLTMTVLGWWRRRPTPSAMTLFIAALCIAYLLLPLTHHLLGTDGYFYISNSDNFFAQSVITQLLAWLITAGIALLLTKLRRKYERHDG